MNTGNEPDAIPVAAVMTQTVPVRPKRKSPLKIILAVLGLLALGVVAYSAVMRQMIGVYYIPSEAMEPTLMGHDAGPTITGISHADSAHDHIMVNKLVYRSREPQFGDIIVFDAPKEADAEHKYSGVQVENTLVKRVIGLPGDTIEIKEGRVYRNGQPLLEPYIKEPMDMGLEPNFVYGTSMRGGPVHVGPQQLWVMGDNRNDSNDSRYWGLLERRRIIGKVTSIIAPPDRQRSFP